MRKLWTLGMAISVSLVMTTMTLAVSIPLITFQANATLANGNGMAAAFVVNQDNSVSIHILVVKPGKLELYNLEVDSEGTIKEMWHYNKQLHGEEALQTLATLTHLLGDLLEAPKSIVPPSGSKIGTIDKSEAWEALQYWHKHFDHYGPKTPTTWGGIKAEIQPNREQVDNEIANLKDVLSDINDGAANGKAEVVPVMAGDLRVER